MTNFPLAFSALLLLVPPAGAFVQQRPAVSFSSAPADGTSALSVKEDVTDATETIETIEADLDMIAFVAEMDKGIEGISALKEAAGVGTLIPNEAKGGDVYTRAIAKMEAMAQESITKHQADMEEFNSEVDVATKNELDAKARRNGPLVAFSFLGLAIGGAMVATAPEAINGIDISAVVGSLHAIDLSGINIDLPMPQIDLSSIGGLPAVDLSGINIDLPMPQIDLSSIGTNVDLSAMTTAFLNTKDALLARADGFSASFPTIVDEVTSQAQELAGSISSHVQGSVETLMTQVDLIGDNLVSQVSEVRDVTIPAVQSNIAAQADALQANVLSVGELQNTATAHARNVQYFVGPMVDGQVESIQTAFNDAQFSISSHSNDVIQEVTNLQNAALTKAGEFQLMSAEQVVALQDALQAKASSIDLDAIVEQAKVGTDEVVQQATSSFADANELIQTQISDAKVYGDAVIGEATVSLQSFEMPNIDVSTFVDRAKNIQEAVSIQIADIELPTPIDFSSLKEAVNKAAEESVGSLTDIAPILQKNLGIPL